MGLFAWDFGFAAVSAYRGGEGVKIRNVRLPAYYSHVVAPVTAYIAKDARLREWIEADRQWLRQLQHLSVAARAWNDVGRPDGELYRGARLEAAIEAKLCTTESNIDSMPPRERKIARASRKST